MAAAQNLPVRLRMRKDLRVSEQTHQGVRQWVLKDPLSSRYYRLGPQQFAVLELLDGQRSLSQIKDALRKRFPQLAATHSQLQTLVTQLHRSGVVTSETLGQGEQLLTRFRRQQHQQRIAKLLSVFAIRLPGVDPERFLTATYRWFRWIYHPVAVAACVAMMVAALLTILIDFDHFLSRMPAFHEFFGGGNLVWMMFALAVAKVVHELGHGLTCKHFGGECHEIGLMFLVFTPCLYCDTSDSWMVSSKWRRAAIGAAGMYFELTLAAVCTFLWFSTNPGLLNFLCLNTIFVCSVSTLLFNCNPLLRFDGYYILSDLMEVPNLSRKAQSALVGLLRKLCLGLPWAADATLPTRQRILFVVYAVAAFFYRMFVLLVILWFVSEIFEPYGLDAISDILIAVSLTGLIVVPSGRLLKFFLVPGRLAQVNRMRLLGTFCVLLALSGFVVFVPLPHHVYATVLIQARDATRVYVEVDGTLDELLVKPNTDVIAGAPLVRLSSPELQYDAEKLRGQMQQLETRLMNLRRQQSDDPNVSQSIPHTLTSLQDVRERLETIQQHQSRLTLVAPVGGRLFSPASVPESVSNESQLEQWSGTPLQPENVGCFLPAGTLVCMIGSPHQFEAVAMIDQADADYLQEEMESEIVLDELPAHRWVGEISEIAAVDTKVAPRELSMKTGGNLMTTTDATGAERPSVISYQTRIPIADDDQRLVSGFRGQAKIRVGESPLAVRLLRIFNNTFRF